MELQEKISLLKTRADNKSQRKQLSLLEHLIIIFDRVLVSKENIRQEGQFNELDYKEQTNLQSLIDEIKDLEEQRDCLTKSQERINEKKSKIISNIIENEKDIDKEPTLKKSVCKKVEYIDFGKEVIVKYKDFVNYYGISSNLLTLLRKRLSYNNDYEELIDLIFEYELEYKEIQEQISLKELIRKSLIRIMAVEKNGLELYTINLLKLLESATDTSKLITKEESDINQEINDLITETLEAHKIAAGSFYTDDFLKCLTLNGVSKEPQKVKKRKNVKNNLKEE
ncbi:MAG: hypothetical protein R3Y21_03640 [Mycoplasmatota bacterium]